jgi:hypothetical protein
MFVEHDAQPVRPAVIGQRHVLIGGQRLAVQFDLCHATANPMRVLHFDLIEADVLSAAVAIAEPEARPVLRNAWLDAQPVAAPPEAEHGLQSGAYSHAAEPVYQVQPPRPMCGATE